MTKVNRGKDLENQIRTAFENVQDTSVDRLPDQMSGYVGSSNICDFVIYHYPHQYYIECKSCYGNTLSINSNNPKHKYGDITNNQWEGLLKKSKITGVVAGYIIWFIDHDITVFISAESMQKLKDFGDKSVHVIKSLQKLNGEWYAIPGKKRRVLFDYDLSEFLGEVR